MGPLRIFCCVVGFLIFSTSCQARSYALPVRVKAISDVLELEYGKYAVRECLEVYNDDYNIPLIITKVTADSWRGHQKQLVNEVWLSENEALEILPGDVKRVVERKRIVNGRKGRNWWVRWLKFRINTNRGNFCSNSIASPFKAPEKVETILKEQQIDSLSEPAGLTPMQKRRQNISP
jgi:hypothetical protein